jgi:hypothetical protein
MGSPPEKGGSHDTKTAMDSAVVGSFEMKMVSTGSGTKSRGVGKAVDGATLGDILGTRVGITLGKALGEGDGETVGSAVHPHDLRHKSAKEPAQKSGKISIYLKQASEE